MLRFRTRKEAEAAGVLRERSEADNPAPLPGRVDGGKPVRDARSRTKTERRSADTPTRPDARGDVRDRRSNKRRRAELGEQVGDASQTFELDLAPGPVQSLESRVAMDHPAGASSRRVLLAGIPLPMPPSINAYWSERIVWSEEKKRHFAIRYVTHEGKDYQQTIREMMLERKAWYRSPHLLILRMLCCFPDDSRDRDIDNRVKVLQDALKHGFVYQDDVQIRRLEVREGPLTKPSVVFVHLEEFLPNRRANLDWIRGPVDLPAGSGTARLEHVVVSQALPDLGSAATDVPGTLGDNTV